MANLNYKAEHPAYKKAVARWYTTDDVLSGEEMVKLRGLKYLPLENNEPNVAAYQSRYKAYLQRAVFYNATARTLGGLVGQVFSKPPEADFGAPDDVRLMDPAGTGVTLEQHAKWTLAQVIAKGRAGLWVDFPKADAPVTLADVERGMRPTIHQYKPNDIINWRTTRFGGRTLLTLVVLREDYLADDDGFTMTVRNQYRILRLQNGVYTSALYRENGNQPTLTTDTPLGYDGKPLAEIPFVFVGITNNDSDVDEAPLYDLVSLNLAHYRNSADYEESVFMLGQPTPVWAGVDKVWAEQVWKGQVRLGSRSGVNLPLNGQAQLLQVSPNGLAKEAMDQKEAQMVALGARLVRDSNVAKTATEVTGDKVNEVSVLASAARNTSAAYREAFRLWSLFLPSKTPTFNLSTDFEMSKMTSQQLLAVVTTWQSGLLATSESRSILRAAGLATLTMDEAKKEGVPEKPPVATETSTADRTDNRANQTS